MAKLTPYQLADIFSSAYQNAQRQKMLREKEAQERSFLERQAEIESLKELDKARRSVMDEYVPYGEDLQIKSGAQPITGSQIESGYGTLLQMTQGDLLPDDQKYIRREDVVQPKESSPVRLQSKEIGGKILNFNSETGEYFDTGLRDKTEGDKNKNVNQLFGRVKQGITKIKSAITNPVDSYGFELSPEGQQKAIQEATADYIDDADQLVRELGLVNAVEAIESKLEELDKPNNALSGKTRDDIINDLIKANNFSRQEREALKLYFDLIRPEIKSNL